MHNENQRILINFKKARSHTDTIIKMVEAKEHPIDVMQQNFAVIGLLRSAHQMLLEEHLKVCFSNTNKATHEKQEEMIEKILKASRIVTK